MKRGPTFSLLRRAFSAPSGGGAPGRPLFIPQVFDFPFCLVLDTRWEDMDSYGHMNNVKYYSLFDTAVNRLLLQERLLSLPPAPGAPIGLVVASSCSFFKPLSFPAQVTVGVRVGKLGPSSVTYEVGAFAKGGPCAAAGTFTHVYVDSTTRKAQPLPDAMREALGRFGAVK